MPTKPKRAARLYVERTRVGDANRRVFVVKFIPPNSDEPQVIHSLPNEQYAALYAEGVMDGFELARNLLYLHRIVGNRELRTTTQKLKNAIRKVEAEQDGE